MKKLILLLPVIAVTVLAVCIGHFVMPTQNSVQAVSAQSNGLIHWQQPTWASEQNDHGSIIVRHSAGQTPHPSFALGFNAFNRFGWDMPSVMTIGCFWRLELEYEITLQGIWFELGASIDTDTWLTVDPIDLHINGQDFSFMPERGRNQVIPLQFDFDNVVVDYIQMDFGRHESMFSTANSLSFIRNMTIIAAVPYEHHSAYDTYRIDDYLEHHSTWTLLARDFEVLFDGAMGMTLRMTIDGHPAGITSSAWEHILIQDFGIHTGWADHRVYRIPQDAELRGIFIRYENGQINFFDKHFIPATEESIIEVEIVGNSFSRSNPHTGGSGSPGVIRGWSADSIPTCRMFTVYVWDLNGNEIGVIEFEMDMSGNADIWMSWILYHLPELNVDGQNLESFFLVNRETGVINDWEVWLLRVYLVDGNSVTIALNYEQITHTITFRVQHGIEIEILDVITLNWGDIIPDPNDLFDLENRRGWFLMDWQHSPITWTNDWNIVPIIGTPITRNYTITAIHSKFAEITVRFFEPRIDSWGISHRMLGVTRIYENELVDMDSIMIFQMPHDVPLSQYTPNILEFYTWGGGWITHSGFLDNHVLDDNPFVVPWGIHNAELNFIPLMIPIDFQVSFMAWDGSLLASVDTIGGHVCMDTIPDLPTIDGLMFSHWFNSQGLNLESRITANVNFWAVYVTGDGSIPNNGNDTDPPNENDIQTWQIVIGGLTGLLVILIVGNVILRAFRPKRKRRYN